MNIQFKNLKDEKPKHRSAIAYIYVSGFYGSWEFLFDEVEYCWDNDNGDQICYDVNEVDHIDKDEFKLFVGFGHIYLPMDSDNTVFWAYIDDVNELLEKEGL